MPQFLRPEVWNHGVILAMFLPKSPRREASFTLSASVEPGSSLACSPVTPVSISLFTCIVCLYMAIFSPGHQAHWFRGALYWLLANYICSDPPSKWGYILRYWGLGRYGGLWKVHSSTSNSIKTSMATFYLLETSKHHKHVYDDTCFLSEKIIILSFLMFCWAWLCAALFLWGGIIFWKPSA